MECLNYTIGFRILRNIIVYRVKVCYDISRCLINSYLRAGTVRPRINNHRDDGTFKYVGVNILTGAE